MNLTTHPTEPSMDRATVRLSPCKNSWLDLSPEVAAVVLSQLRIVDVREPAEFYGELGHLPGSALVPLAQLERAMAAWSPGQPLIVVCRSGRRASAAAEQLVSAGFPNVFNLAGGLLAWTDESRPTCPALEACRLTGSSDAAAVPLCGCGG